ncbi:Core-2/I-branching beta-1,6-N-acetylglucosaminyltransferase family protein [Striga asiatica]|uniref:Core-2/I-branching beta-1,6-N-acetylglucosaminyltransferase family protein n=1 Tax=Striga asiatica TaxID=4170 RepID=A0A5A7QGF8_STRAF|nr:Core-2/I-branching beta-1,6-N-acetylglucosaminyltransferase family protein [Striga asiatica]
MKKKERGLRLSCWAQIQVHEQRWGRRSGRRWGLRRRVVGRRRRKGRRQRRGRRQRTEIKRRRSRWVMVQGRNWQRWIWLSGNQMRWDWWWLSPPWWWWSLPWESLTT